MSLLFTFDQFNAYVLNKSINNKKTKILTDTKLSER